MCCFDHFTYFWIAYGPSMGWRKKENVTMTHTITRIGLVVNTMSYIQGLYVWSTYVICKSHLFNAKWPFCWNISYWIRTSFSEAYLQKNSRQNKNKTERKWIRTPANMILPSRYRNIKTERLGTKCILKFFNIHR